MRKVINHKIVFPKGKKKRQNKKKSIFEFIGYEHDLKEKKAICVCENCKHRNNIFKAFLSKDKLRFFLVCNVCGGTWAIDKNKSRRK